MSHTPAGARRRTPLLRSVTSGVAALALGSLLAAGMAVPAVAATAVGVSASPAVSSSSSKSSSSLSFKVLAGKTAGAGATVVLYESYEAGQYLNLIATKKASTKGTVTFGHLTKNARYIAKVVPAETDPAFAKYATGWFGASIGTTGAAAASSDAAASRSYKLTRRSVSKTLSLSVGGVLSGVLYGSDGKLFTAGFTVVTYKESVGADANYDDPAFVHESTDYVQPSASGAYLVPGLNKGTYIVEFDQSVDPTQSTRVFNNKAVSRAVAEAAGGWSFDGSAGSLDAHLVAAGSIAGTVSFAPAFPSTSSLGTVEAYTANDASANGDLFATAPIAADGTYGITGLTPNDYAVRFVPAETDSATYYSEWYDDAPIRANGKLVSVTAGTVAEADSELASGYSLTGVVTDHTGAPVKNAYVQLTDPDWDPSSNADEYLSAETDSRGRYTFTDLPPAAYVLEFVNDASALDRYYAVGATGGVRDTDLASPVTFTGGEHTIDFQFKQPSTLTVHIATRKGVSISGAEVHASAVSPRTPASGSNVGQSSGYAEPVRGKPGYYTFIDLEAGTEYALYFDVSYSDRHDVYPQFLGGSTDFAEADLVTARPGAHTVDATLAVSGSLSGKVVSPAGKPVKNGVVRLFRYNGSSWDAWDQTQTSSTGIYKFANLDSASYTVAFFSDSQSAFAGGGATPESARAFYIAPGKPVVFNFKLPAPGKLTGVVTNSNGKKLADVLVVALLLNGTPGKWIDYTSINGDTTDQKGAYSIGGLNAGTYTLGYVVNQGETTQQVVVGDLGDPALPTFDVVAGKKLTAGTTKLPAPAPSAPATGVISGSLDTKILRANGYVSFYVSTGYYSVAINPDGTFTGTLPPGHYDYSAEVSSDSTDAIYETVEGSIDIVTGANLLTLPVTLWATPRFATPPTLNTTATAVGTSYSASASWNNPVSSTVSYQWLRDGKAIKWATGDTYASRGSDLGSVLSVELTLSNEYVSDTVSAVATVGVVTESSAFGNTELPTITGSSSALAGTTLKVNPGEWSVPGATFTYQWFRNDTVLVGRDSSYTLAPEDADQGISVVVHASKVGYEDAEATSRTMQVAPTSTLVVVTQPTLAGTNPAPVNSVLRISAGEWSVPAKYTYSWLRDGKLIPGATGNAYRATDRDFGYEISAQVTATAAGFTSATVETNGYVISLAAAAVASKRPTISGKAAVGVALTVKPGVWNHSTLSFTYAWKSDGVVIEGATADRFTPTASQKGTRITVEVTAKRHGYLDGTATTATTYVIK